MVHVDLSYDMHMSLCRLKEEARGYWNDYFSNNNLDIKKGKISIEEVIAYLYHSR